MHALRLDKNKRIEYACIVLPDGKYDGMPIVDEIPDGNLPDYLYIDGEFIYDPLPIPEQPEPKPTQEERITALENQLAAYEVAYTQGVNEA